MGEFFWGVVVGVVLTAMGGFLQVYLQSRQTAADRLKLIRNFTADSAQNIQRIVADMDETRRRVNAIHSEFLMLLDVEIQVFGRNRENIVVLPEHLREKVRAYMNDCALLKAEVGGGLAEFNRLFNLADQLQAAGDGPQAGRNRESANIPLAAANKALDRLVTRSRDAASLVAELKR